MIENEPGTTIRSTSRHVQIALAVVLIAVSAAYLLRPIRDLDFFWHLKTGELIWEQRELPASDPFSYTGTTIATPNVRLTLTSYWAWQVLFYASYSLGGMTGVVALRFLFGAALLAVLWQRLQGDRLISVALLLVFAVTFFEEFAVERPQVLSFLFFGVLLLLLDILKGAAGSATGGPSPARGFRGPLLLALLMLVWANSHGGFILGQATIALYLAVEGAKFAHRSLRPIRGDAYRALVVAGVAGLVASLANPNLLAAWDAILSPAEPQGHNVRIIEYISTVEALLVYRNYPVLVVWTLMLIAVVAVVANLKSVDLTEAILLGASGYFAFQHVRYQPLFMIVALPLIGRALSRGAWVRLARPPLIAGALALVIVFARDELHGAERLRTRDWVDRAMFPVDAVDFIVASGLRGNMYNFYNWGGYLIWKLAPERKVFVDGRNLNPGMHWLASIVQLGYEGGGQRRWKALLDAYGVAFTITPHAHLGNPLRIVDRLRNDPDWAPVWSDQHAIIFVRASLLRR